MIKDTNSFTEVELDQSKYFIMGSTLFSHNELHIVFFWFVVGRRGDRGGTRGGFRWKPTIGKYIDDDQRE